MTAAPPCPICNAPTRAFTTKRRFDRDWLVHKCTRCGHGFVVNRPSLDELQGYYSQHQAGAPRVKPTVDDLERRPDCITFTQRIAQLTDQRGRTLDIGSGGGGFSYHLAKLGFSPVVLNDLDPESADVTPLIPNSTFIHGPFENVELPKAECAAIVMSQVLEHTLDPIDWLRRARDLLHPTGVLAVAVPNFGGIYRLLGTRDPFLIPPFHLNYFTAQSLRHAMEQSGLEVLRMESRSVLSTEPTKATQRMSTKRRLLARLWNALSWPLAPTRQGIILRAFARPAT